jgi:hypothetical protein
LTDTARLRRACPATLTAPSGTFGWGSQIDVRDVPTAAQDRLADGVASRERIAGYLGKYATKHTEALGPLDHRLRPHELATLPVNAHIHRLVLTCWLVQSNYPRVRLAAWSHQLGFGGHWLTKSRRYSTTLTALRAARAEWRAARDVQPAAPLDPATTVTWTRWHVQGIGHPDDATAAIAATVRASAADARTAHRAALSERVAALDDLALDHTDLHAAA